MNCGIHGSLGGNSINKMDTSIFEELGLTQSEIKVYLKLLELKSSLAGPIIEHTGLQTSVVHRSLNTLIEKGLINFIIEGKRRIYQATQPDNFIDFIEEKKRRFQQILPELRKIEHSYKEKENATIYKGTRGVAEVYTFMASQKGEYNTFGGGKECAARMGIAWWLNIHSKRVANKLASRQVFDESVKKDAKDIESKPLTKIRYLNKEFASFQETVIVGEYVAISVFTDSPYSFLVHDPKVAESYRRYFEVLWELAKP